MLTYIATFAPTVAICVNVVPSVERSTLNPVSLFELSVQDRLIWLDDTAVAVRFVGERGVGHTPEYELTLFEYGELPFMLYARTRKYRSPACVCCAV
jgi:hypothetical protein